MDDSLKHLWEHTAIIQWLAFAVVAVKLVVVAAKAIIDIPILNLPVRLLLLVLFLAMFAPGAWIAFDAFSAGEGIPTSFKDPQHGIGRWPYWAVALWLTLLASSAASLLFDLFEPFKDEIVARLPKWVDHATVFAAISCLYGGAPTFFVWFYSRMIDQAILSLTHIALLSFTQLGAGVTLAGWLRTKGVPRFLADGMGLGVFAIVLVSVTRLINQEAAERLMYFAVWPVVFWVLFDLVRYLRERRAALPTDTGSPPPPSNRSAPVLERTPHSALVATERFICKVCDREFVTLRGLRIHEGRMHPVRGVEVPAASANRAPPPDPPATL